jgi:hypothetical protein
MEFLLIAYAVQSSQAQDHHNPLARQVRRQRGVPITSLLRPSEKQLVVRFDRFPDGMADPLPGVSYSAWLTQLSDVVMRARVESRESALTSDQDWINTSVRAKVLQILKWTGRRSFAEGQEVSFLEEGGGLDLGGRQIDAIVEWADRCEVDKEYLIFAELNADNDLVVGPGSTYEIVSGKTFRSLLKTARDADSIPKSSVNSVLEDIMRNTMVKK